MNKFKICAVLLSLTILFSCGYSKESNNYSSSSSQQEERRASKGLSPKVESVVYKLENINKFNTRKYDNQKIVIVSPEISIENALAAESKINKILSDKYGLNKKVFFIGIDDSISYQDKLIKYVSEGGQVDIVCTGYNSVGYGVTNSSSGTYQEFVDNDWLVDLTKYLNSNDGKQLKEAYSNRQWQSVSIKDKIYGVNGNQLLGDNQILSFNTQICEDNGINLSDYDGSLKQIKHWCDILKNNSVECDYFYGGLTSINDAAELVGMLPNYQLTSYGIGVYQTENGLKAVNIYDDENIRNLVADLSDLYASGYIFDMVMQETTGCYFVKNESNINNQKNNLTNKNWIDPYCENINNFVCGVCTMSKDTDTAFKVLAALYCDKDLSNLLQYGTDDISEISQEQYESISTYCSIGNRMITFPNKFYGETENKTAEIIKYNESVKDNPLLGFRLDLSKSDFNTLYEINSQSENIFMGYCSDDWEDCMNKISEQLKTANIDKAIEDVNFQLEEFYEKNN